MDVESVQPAEDPPTAFVLTRRECLVGGGMLLLAALQPIALSVRAAEALARAPPLQPPSGFRRVYLDK